MTAQVTGSLKRQLVQYVTGFLSALVLTAVAFWLAMGRVLDGGWLVAALAVLAAIQLTVQLVFFLHIGTEGRPRWNLTAFIFMSIMLLVIVVGSIWIMYNMNYNMMMTSEQMDAYMKTQAAKGF